VWGFFFEDIMTHTHLTKSTKIVLKYYLGLGKERFRLSLDTIATALDMSAKTVSRSNNRLRELGVLAWVSGHGDLRAGGANCTPNEYLISPAAIRAHKSQQKPNNHEERTTISQEQKQ
jgi:hypothetical protein